MNNPRPQPCPPVSPSAPAPTPLPSSAAVPSSDTAAASQITVNPLNPIKSQFRQPRASRLTNHYPLTPNPWPLIPAVLLLLLLLTACGRRPGEPTPLPLGTRVAQPTPDFSAPAQPTAATDNAQAVRTRIAQQRTQATPLTPGPSPLTPGPSPLTPGPSPLTPAVPPAVPAYPSLAVFSRPTALGILSGGGLLYSAPGGGAVANLQIGATLTITGRSADGAWFAVYLADGAAGWVPAAQVRVFGDAAQLEIVQESLGPAVVATLIAEASKPQEPIVLVNGTPTPAVPPAVTPAVPLAVPPAVTVIVEGANLRAGPGTDFPVVGGLYQDQKAALLGRNPNGDWLQVELPDGLGWIFAPLVQTTLPIAELPIIDPPPEP